MRSLRMLGRFVVGVGSMTALVCASPAAADDPPITPTHLPYPPAGTHARGPGINASNENAQLADSVGAELTQSWHAVPGPCTDADDTTTARSISVTSTRTIVSEEQSTGCSYVSAYSNADGRLLWRHRFEFGPASAAQTDGQFVYVYSAGTIHALRESTGALAWLKAAGTNETHLNLALGGGAVAYGDRWYDLATIGLHDFVPGPGQTTDVTTLLAGGRAFLNSTGNIQANTMPAGAVRWTRRKSQLGGAGDGNARPSLHSGLLYVIGTRTAVLDAATGRTVRVLPRSVQPIAFDGPVGFFTGGWSTTQSATVSAIALDTGHVYWTYEFPTEPDQNGSARTVAVLGGPLVENGLVWVNTGTDVSLPGRLVALDEVTGAPVTATTEPCAAFADVVVAQHRLFASTFCGVVTYTAS